MGELQEKFVYSELDSCLYHVDKKTKKHMPLAYVQVYWISIRRLTGSLYIGLEIQVPYNLVNLFMIAVFRSLS